MAKPTYLDRSEAGPEWTVDEVALHVVQSGSNYPVEQTATIMAEAGGLTWARPMVLKDPEDPDQRAHLSMDRGICQFNSYWWGTQALIMLGPNDWRYVSDQVAFMPGLAIERMTIAVNLDMLGYWNAYGTANYKSWESAARRAVEAVI